MDEECTCPKCDTCSNTADIVLGVFTPVGGMERIAYCVDCANKVVETHKRKLTARWN